jgi:hypothetical protein
VHHPENLVREASMPTGAAEPPRSVHGLRLSSAPVLRATVKTATPAPPLGPEGLALAGGAPSGAGAAETLLSQISPHDAPARNCARIGWQACRKMQSVRMTFAACEGPLQAGQANGSAPGGEDFQRAKRAAPTDLLQTAHSGIAGVNAACLHLVLDDGRALERHGG